MNKERKLFFVLQKVSQLNMDIDTAEKKILRLFHIGGIKVYRPKRYQPIKEVLSSIKDFKEGTKFKLRSINAGCWAAFVKYENKTLYYTTITDNPVVSTTKVRMVALHKIKFIKKTK